MTDLLALSTTTTVTFESNQRKWVKLILCGRAPFSSHLLEALQRRKVYLEEKAKRQSEKVQANIRILLSNPTEASSGVGKALTDSGEQVTNLVAALREVAEAMTLVEAYLKEYPTP